MSLPSADQNCPRVFVSKPSVVTPAQRDLEQMWIGGLARLDLAPIMLRREDYLPSPWAALRHAISTAHGALLLGFRQAHIEQARWRPETPEEREFDGWLATPWNQIEGGLVVMAGLPVLVVPENDVTEGIFARDCWTDEVLDAPIDAWASNDPAGHPQVRAWADAVSRHAASKSRHPESVLGDGAPRTRT